MKVEDMEQMARKLSQKSLESRNKTLEQYYETLSHQWAMTAEVCRRLDTLNDPIIPEGMTVTYDD